MGLIHGTWLISRADQQTIEDEDEPEPQPILAKRAFVVQPTETKAPAQEMQ